MTFRAAADRRVSAGRKTTVMGAAETVKQPEEQAAHPSIQSADADEVHSAICAWMETRRSGLYRDVRGSKATRGKRKAGVHQIVQRERVGAQVVESLPPDVCAAL